MAKKSKKQIPIQDPKKILEFPLSKMMHDSMMPYAEYVILDRALPRLEDGLKPVQRRILVAMHELGITPDKPYKKSARVVGETMGKYHPHGDSSIYGAMVRLAQDFNMRQMLVDGHGNFGSIDGDTAAASRYTEVRMTPLAMEMLADIEKETVDYQLNFDDSLKEPVVLPAKYPNLLVNGASGIAVGFTTNIPPHNLSEVIDATIYCIKHKRAKPEDIMEIIPGPDFPTGAVITNPDEITNAYKKGRGKIKVRAKVDIEKAGNKTLIVISELPYQINKAMMLSKILQLRDKNAGILSSISDIRDESDRDGIRAVIELKKGTNVDLVLNYLYKYSDLQTTFGANMVAIVDGKPKVVSLVEMLNGYIDHQKDVVTRSTKYDLERALKREHILEGLMKALDIIDEIITLIRISKNSKDARIRLMEAFDFTEIQAQAILDLRLHRLTNLEIVDLREEHAELVQFIAKLRLILGDVKELEKVIIKQLLAIKDKYGDDRRTKIENIKEEEVVKPEDFIVEEDIIVMICGANEIKRLSPKNYQKFIDSVPTDENYKNEYNHRIVKAKTTSKILLFTNTGSCYNINGNNIPECRINERPLPLTRAIGSYNMGEIVVDIIADNDFNETDDLLFVTKNGQIKKTALHQYKAQKTKIQACGLREGDEVVCVMRDNKEESLCIATAKGNVIRFMSAEVNRMGRTANGVRAINLRNDYVVSANFANEEYQLAILTDAGFAKRVSIGEFPLQKRGGLGVKSISFYKNNANGKVVIDTCVIKGRQKLIIRTESGQLIIDYTDIRKLNRESNGVCIIKPENKSASKIGVLTES